MHRPFVSMLFGFVLAATSRTALAGTEEEYAKAEAELKLKEAKAAEKDGKIPVACQLYEESFNHAPDKSSPFAMNVEYDLIQCWAQIGRYRDAYLQATELVKKVPDEESSVGLKKRILEIKQEAPCIKLDVPAHLRNIIDLKPFIDGIEVPPAYWAPAYCWPVNVGEHEITATGRGQTWKTYSVKTHAPRRQYMVGLSNPEPVAPPALAPKSTFSISGLPAILTGVGVALVLGGVPLLACTDKADTKGDDCVNYKHFAAAFAGAGAGIAAVGFGISVAATVSAPTPKTLGAASMNLGVGFVGHF